MDWREIDFRYSWTRETLEALDHGLEKLSTSVDDGLDLLEHSEEVVGLGFVALQTYVADTTATLRRVFPGPFASDEALRSRNGPSTLGVTIVEGVWAAANYYKHHDDWPDWRAVRARKNTVLTLGRLGISEATEFPCVEMMNVLQGRRWASLVGFLEVASAWREASFSEHHAVTMLPRRPLQRM